MSQASRADASVRLPGSAWAPHDRKTAWLCAILIGACLLFLIAAVQVNSGAGKPYLSGDFCALWSWAKIAARRPVAELYDPLMLHSAQVALGMTPQDEYPFSYPPTVLLLLWPIGLLPYLAAYLAWVGVTLPLCVLASCAGARCKASMAAATLLAPSTAICLVSGQSGFLLAALLVGGLRLLPHRPILAGVLFGLLTYKPQFGILVPVALVAAGQWRCIAAACVTTASMIAATTAAFGSIAWETWTRTLPAYAAWFYKVMAENPFIPTVVNNLQRLGASQGPARAVQGTAALAAGVVVWRAWRLLPHGLAVPALLAATCLATPYAFVYDLPMLSSAVFLFAAHRLRSAGSLWFSEIVVLVLVLAIPAVAVFPSIHIPVSTVAIGLFLTLIMSAGRATVRPGLGSEHVTGRASRDFALPTQGAP